MKKKDKNDILQSLALTIDKQESGIKKPDTERIETLIKCGVILERETEGATIENHIQEPFNSMGWISLSSKSDIIINNPQKLSEILLYVSNINAYSKADGSIQIDFTFHGLAKPD